MNDQPNTNTMKEAAVRTIPSEYAEILNPDTLAKTLQHLEFGLSDVFEKGAAKEAAYQNKAELMKRSRELETEIQLQESSALMQVQGEGRSAYAVVGDQKFTLSNEDARNAYRRMASKELREEKSFVDAQIQQIEVNLFRANDAWQTAVQAVGLVQSKARLQAALLNYLAGGQA